MATTFQAIATVTVGAGGVGTIDFTNIPQTYTDLCLVSSLDTNRTEDAENVKVTFNNVGSGYIVRNVAGNGSTIASTSNFGVTDFIFVGQYANSATLTANVFSVNKLYIPNYKSSASKAVSMESVVENNNSTFALNVFAAGLWTESGAITSIKLAPADSTLFVQYSTATLYGIKNA